MTDVEAPWTSGRGASRPSAVGLDVAARIGQERLIDAERPGDLHLLRQLSTPSREFRKLLEIVEAEAAWALRSRPPRQSWNRAAPWF